MLEFSKPILGISDFNGPKLWDLSEKYLGVNYKNTAYEIKSHEKDGSYIAINTHSQSDKLISSLIKISYIFIIPPLVALIAKACYRRYYHITVIDRQNDQRIFEPSPKLRKQIAERKKSHEVAHSKIKSEPCLIISQANKHSLLQVELPTDKQLMQFDGYLKNLSTFKGSGQQVLEMTQLALTNLVDSQHSDAAQVSQRLNFAKCIYKKLSCFLRAHTTHDYIQEYKNDLYALSRVENCYNSISPPEVFMYNGSPYSAACFLLKHLRKQIKLVSKEDMIVRKIEEASNLKELSDEIKKKALPCLRVTWLHGTKALAIKTACEKTEGQFLPSGELQKRQVNIATGEMARGSLATGINAVALSGVNLSNAKLSMQYAKDFKLDSQTILNDYKTFLDTDYNKFDSFVNSNQLTRMIVSIRHMQVYYPEMFADARLKIAAKYEALHAAIDHFIFKNGYFMPVREVIAYEILAAFNKLEDILATPPEKVIRPDEQDLSLGQIEVVVASSKKYGEPCEMSGYVGDAEEAYYGGLAFGKELDVFFVQDEDKGKVEELLKEKGLDGKVKIESMKVLEAAHKIDEALRPYFYDVYSLNKWEKGL